MKYFLITFDVRKRPTFFRGNVGALLKKHNIKEPAWMKKHDSIWYPSHRTWGYFDTFEETEDLMMNHSMHWSEGETNEYGLIECVPHGPSPCMNRRTRGFKEMQWYKLNFDTELYEKCERPNHLCDGFAQIIQFCF